MTIENEQGKRIWLLTTGEYSDYNVHAVFDDEHKEEAERIAILIGGGVEEAPMILNRFDREFPPEGMGYFSFTMYRDGSVEFFGNEVLPLLEECGKRRRQYYSLDCKERYDWHAASRWRLLVNVYARDKKHAVKIANEIRTQLLGNKNKPFWKDIP